jgi:site-specific DNA recombinase
LIVSRHSRKRQFNYPILATPVGDADSIKRAVLYLRVSTAKQADKDDDPEGYSVPAQREAGYRKAEQLGAEVVESFVDKGESAKTANRREFQRMLGFIREQGNIHYLIVDKGGPVRPQPT